MAHSLHEIARMLGSNRTITDLLSVVSEYSTKDLDDVKMGILAHLSEFFEVGGEGGREGGREGGGRERGREGGRGKRKREGGREKIMEKKSGKNHRNRGKKCNFLA